MKEYVLLGIPHGQIFDWWLKDEIFTLEEAYKISKKFKRKGFKSLKITCFDRENEKIKRNFYKAVFLEAKRVLNNDLYNIIFHTAK